MRDTGAVPLLVHSDSIFRNMTLKVSISTPPSSPVDVYTHTCNHPSNRKYSLRGSCVALPLVVT